MSLIKDKGFKLFKISTGYIILSYLYFNIFWQSELAMKLGVIWGTGFLFIMFYYGYKMKDGFVKGAMVGTLGAMVGVLLVLFSIFLIMVNTPDGGQFVVMIPWSYPFLGLYNAMPYYGIINNYFPHISVLVVIFLTALGSWTGKH